MNRGDRPHYLEAYISREFLGRSAKQESHALFALSQANALCRLEANQTLDANSQVDVNSDLRAAETSAGNTADSGRHSL